MRRSVTALLLAIAVAGCSGTVEPTISVGDPTAPPHTGPPVVTLTVFAASSLKGALDAAALAYEAYLPEVAITIATDSSAALATQIEQGAPADVFLSADTTNPVRLVAGGFADGNPRSFAGNALVIIVAPDNPGVVATPFDLAKAGLKVIAAGDDVPITKYATQLVKNLAALPGAPPSFEAAYAANVVSREDNVKAVVAKIELGEGDAAIAYGTDARTARDIATIDIPPASNVSVIYAGVVVKASPNRPYAHDFLAWLAAGDGRTILEAFGFLPAPP
jgi:molybdate transport system substrate-binding protein